MKVQQSLTTDLGLKQVVLDSDLRAALDANLAAFEQSADEVQVQEAMQALLALIQGLMTHQQELIDRAIVPWLTRVLVHFPHTVPTVPDVQLLLDFDPQYHQVVSQQATATVAELEADGIRIPAPIQRSLWQLGNLVPHV